MKKNIIRIITGVLITLAFAALAAFFTRTQSEWYTALIKPAIQPPPTAFTVAWGIIYALFAASFAVSLVKNDGKGALPYVINLVLITLWCVIFFVGENPGAATALLFLTVAFAAWLGVRAYKTSLAAGLLITPYILWIAFALVLSYLTAILN